MSSSADDRLRGNLHKVYLSKRAQVASVVWGVGRGRRGSDVLKRGSSLGRLFTHQAHSQLAPELAPELASERP
jgi:hypothetical protein